MPTPHVLYRNYTDSDTTSESITGLMSFPASRWDAPSGYEFKEWNSSRNGAGTSADPGDLTESKPGYTWYAIWQAVQTDTEYIAMGSDLTSVANAIRAKGGTSAQLSFPTEFVSAIQNIPTGITPSGVKTINTIGYGTLRERVYNYEYADVVTPQGSATSEVYKSIDTNGHVASFDPRTKITTSGWINSGTIYGTTEYIHASDLVSGTKAIVQNGSGIDVTNYASVNVDVQSSDIEEYVISPTSIPGGMYEYRLDDEDLTEDDFANTGKIKMWFEATSNITIPVWEDANDDDDFNVTIPSGTRFECCSIQNETYGQKANFVFCLGAGLAYGFFSAAYYSLDNAVSISPGGNNPDYGCFVQTTGYSKKTGCPNLLNVSGSFELHILKAIENEEDEGMFLYADFDKTASENTGSEEIYNIDAQWDDIIATFMRGGNIRIMLRTSWDHDTQLSTPINLYTITVNEQDSESYPNGLMFGDSQYRTGYVWPVTSGANAGKAKIETSGSFNTHYSPGGGGQG